MNFFSSASDQVGIIISSSIGGMAGLGATHFSGSDAGTTVAQPAIGNQA